MTRKSQYGWMVVGGLLCLCGGVVLLKVREGNPVMAQAAPPGPPAAGPDGPPQLPPAAAAVQMPLPVDGPPLPGATPAPQPLPPPVGAELPDHVGPPPSVSQPAAPPLDAKPPLPPIEPPSPAPAAIDPAPPSAPLPPDAPVSVAPAPPPGSIDPPPPAQPTHQSLAPAPIVAPAPVVPPAAVVQASQIGEPPLAGSGPIQAYQVRTNGETMREIARHTLGTGERCTEVYKLNPNLHPEDGLAIGTLVHLPPDACLPVEEIEGLKPLPAMRPKTAPVKPKTVMALTGTYPCNLDDKRGLTLPRAVREQFGDSEVVLVSPGPDQCLWLTDPAHQERLAERLEHSPAREIDVRVFKRLYYAQTEKVVIGAEGRITLSDRLSQFAGLSQEMVLVGIDDHFEVWDAARWKQYTQVKSAAAAGSE